MQLGLINSSLDIYTNLKMWDDAIKCLVTLDKRDQVIFYLNWLFNLII